MSIEIRVPPLPESVADATVLSWHKKPGDLVSRDETLVDLETDKVVLEVPAPQAGILKEVHYRDGETVQADALLAILDNSSQPATHPAATPATDRSRSAPRRRPLPQRRPAAPPQPARRSRTRRLTRVEPRSVSP